jgi:hypothetical protein
MDGRSRIRKLRHGRGRAQTGSLSGVRMLYRWLQWLVAAGICLALTACADLKGIEAFGKMAPDSSAIQGLTKIYVQEPDTREDIKLLGDSAPNPEIATLRSVRAQQAQTIQALDGSLRNYMQSLSALAGDAAVQSSSNVKEVTTGLTSLSKSLPTLGITANQISVIGHFVQSIADLIESGYRNAQLVAIIHDNDESFQVLLEVQSTIVSRGIKPSIVEIQRSLNEAGTDEVSRLIDQDLQYWTTTPGANAPAKGSTAAEVFNKRNPAFRGQGEADAHVARYLLKKSIEADQAASATQLATADAYIKALDAIGRAHKKLVAGGKNVLTKDMAQQIQPLANEVHQDFQDIETKTVPTAKH